MANQEEFNRINDSTVQQVLAVVQNHNRNYPDEEVAELRNEIDEIQNKLEMVMESIKFKEDMNQEITDAILEIRLHSDIEVKTKTHQIKRLKNAATHSTVNYDNAKSFYEKAYQEWEKKQKKYNRHITKMSEYINDLVSKLETNGIFDYQKVNVPDSNDRREAESADVENLDDETGKQPADQQEQAVEKQPDNDESVQENGTVEANQEADESVQENGTIEANQEADQVVQNGELGSNNEAQHHDEATQCVELVYDAAVQCELDREGQHAEEHIEPDEQSIEANQPQVESNIEDNQPRVEPNIADNHQPQEQNVCDMVEVENSESDQKSQSTEPVDQTEATVTESICVSEEQPQQAISDLNTELGDKVLESEKPIEAEVPQKIKLDPFVHGYVEREKSKKRRQKKPKSKPKYSSLVSFGGY